MHLQFPGGLDWEQQELATESSELSKVVLLEYFEARDKTTFKQCLDQLIRAGINLPNAVVVCPSSLALPRPPSSFLFAELLAPPLDALQQTTNFIHFKEYVGLAKRGTHNAKDNHSPRALLFQISEALHNYEDHFLTPSHMAFVFGGMVLCAISGNILSKMTPTTEAAGIEMNYFEIRWLVEDIPGWDAFKGATLALSGVRLVSRLSLPFASHLSSHLLNALSSKFWHWNRSIKKLHGFNFHGAHNTALFFGAPKEQRVLGRLSQVCPLCHVRVAHAFVG